MSKYYKIITSYTGATEYIVKADSEDGAIDAFWDGNYERMREIDCESNEEICDVQELDEDDVEILNRGIRSERKIMAQAEPQQ